MTKPKKKAAAKQQRPRLLSEPFRPDPRELAEAPVAKPKPKAAATSLRLPTSLLERADALIPHLGELDATSASGQVNRSDVLRIALTRGIEQLEAETVMTFNRIRTIDDAREWLKAQQGSIHATKLHILQKQFDEYAGELNTLAKKQRLKIIGVAR